MGNLDWLIFRGVVLVIVVALFDVRRGSEDL